ncbi:hypothetical protein ScPMuIL_018953 [Solemya velum]
MSSYLSFDNKVFAQFALYATVVLLKTIFLGPSTVVCRFVKKAFANQEDTKLATSKGKTLAVNLSDPDVERVRRCHQNDIENVVPFVLIGLLYVLVGPSATVAVYHFRVFAASRIFHTFAYLVPFPQPCRALAYMTGWVVTFSMSISVLSVAAF